jgi:hypothetical protein
MLDLFEDKDRTYIDILITRYVRALSQLEHLCNAIETRRSIDNILDSKVKINVNNIKNALHAIDTNDTSQWVIHDPGRLGGHLRSLLNIPDDNFNFLINLIKPSEIIKIESALFEAASDIAYTSHSADITTMKSYDIHLKCLEDGKIQYHIQSPTQLYNGEIIIPIEEFDIEKLNSDNAYINTVLPNILERIAQINPSHVDELISNGIMQKYTSMVYSQDFDAAELIIKKNDFVEKAMDELCKHIFHDLNVLLTPAIIEFQKFLNPVTIQMFDEYEDNPIERMNTYVALMYKRQQMIEQITIMQAELPPSAEEHSSNDSLPYDELEHMHHLLYEQLLLQHPNLDEIKENIAILLKQIANYSKINLTEDHQWFAQFNAFEKEIDKAFSPASFVKIYEQMQVACSRMQMTLMELERNYESLWNELSTLTQDYQLPLLETTYISPEDLLNLKPKVYELNMNNMRTMIATLKNEFRPLSESESLSTFINTQALIQNYRDIEVNEINALTDEQILYLSPKTYLEQLEHFKAYRTEHDLNLQNIPLESNDKQPPSEETNAPSHFFDSFFSFFQGKTQKDMLSDLVISEDELRHLKDICRHPYQKFLTSKADKNIKKEKTQIAHQTIDKIEQSTTPSEIHNAIEQSIVSAESAKVSWLGFKTGELMKASLKARTVFEGAIENIKNKLDYKSS